jgi:hypothetical protein
MERVSMLSGLVLTIVLPPLGLDDNKLPDCHAGRFKQLIRFAGKVIDK